MIQRVEFQNNVDFEKLILCNQIANYRLVVD